GRGHGEPVRLMIDLPNEHDIVALFCYRADQKLLLAASDGRGFIVAGKQVLVPGEGAQARICLPVAGDALALLGDNRKLLICRIGEIPEMTRGRGVMLQRYKEGGLADVK